MVVGYVPPRENKRKLIYECRLHIWDESYLFRVCSMAYSEDVYQWKKASRSASDATHHHMEDIMVHSTLIQKSNKVYSSGQPCMKTRKTSFEGVERVRGTGISIQEIPYHSPTTFRLSSSISGKSTTWDLF